MKIAQVAPLYESVPPKYYGGTERIVSYLTEELVHQGHEVTLFASGDSETKARLLAPRHRAMRLEKTQRDYMASHFLMLEMILKRAHEFDIIHYHIDYLHFPFSKRSDTPTITTLHGRLDLPDLGDLYSEFSSIPVVSISDHQRKPLPQANWQGTIYHGLPDIYHFQPKPQGYLAFLGRICPEKRVDRAILAAKKLGMPLKIAAKVDQVDQVYFDTTIQVLLDDPLIDYIGEIGEGEKSEFLGNAKALLFPIDWPEPFGLVMIEAMACGTPVVAYAQGSVPEIIKPGITGYLAKDAEEAIRLVKKIDKIDRKKCRAEFEHRFSVDRMAHDYVSAYKKVLSDKSRRKAKT